MFTAGYEEGQVIRVPVAHHDGNYFADAETLKAVEGNGQVAFRYAEGTNPNGSIVPAYGPHPVNSEAAFQSHSISSRSTRFMSWMPSGKCCG